MIVVSPEWVQEHTERVTLVDVRNRNEYTEGHLPGAINLPINKKEITEPDVFSGLVDRAGISKEDPLVAYDDEKGMEAAQFLLAARIHGHVGELALLETDYSGSNKEDETEERRRSMHSTADLYTAESVLRNVSLSENEFDRRTDDPQSVLIDARTTAEYETSHVPGSENLDALDFLDENGLKTRDERKEIVESAGITPGQDVVVYSHSFEDVALTFAVLSDLDYTAEVYFGGLTKWFSAEAPGWDPANLKQTVVEHADRGYEAVVDALTEEDAEQVFNKLKLVGIYNTKFEGYFMLRTRIPGGFLTAEQAQTIGGVADDFARAPEEHGGENQNPKFGDGFLDITTRQNVQMHWIEIEDIPEIWRRYDEVGLTTTQACGNSVRNIVTCPASGIDDGETVDTRTVVDEINERFLGDHHYANLPRKYKISVTGCRENCARAELNDLGLLPARKDGREGFNVKIGGALSDAPMMARDLDLFVEPDDAVELARAVADIFIAYSSYADPAVNRLKFVVNEIGVEALREQLDSLTSFEFREAGEDLTENYRGDHVGVHRQDDGRKYVGLNVPVGRMAGREFVEAGRLAEEYGDSEVRLTLNQNLLLPGVEPNELDRLLDEPLLKTYSPDPGPFSRGVVACTGREFCNYGIINTKNRAHRWAKELDDSLGDELEDPFRMHMSGCKASCAHPQIGDVGFRGETYRDAYDTGEAVDYGLGGDLGKPRFIEWIGTEVPAEEMREHLERLVELYARESDDGESFSDWVERKDVKELRLQKEVV